MDKTEATRSCRQCHREVAEANFALHEMHCSRFLRLCPDCDEAVPREQLKQHREEQHTQVKCSKCNQRMERRHLVDHEFDECVERMQCCQFCELELPWKELDKHQLVCGSRTELCRDCGCYVTLRAQPEHASSCSAANHSSGPPQTTGRLPPDNITVSCSRCMASISAQDLEKHELECAPSARSDDEEDEPEEESDLTMHGATTWLSSSYMPTCLFDQASSGPLRDGGDPDQISSCPHCHLALPLLTLRWHEVKCQSYILMK